jgi:hypothetical protein
MTSKRSAGRARSARPGAHGEAAEQMIEGVVGAVKGAGESFHRAVTNPDTAKALGAQPGKFKYGGSMNDAATMRSSKIFQRGFKDVSDTDTHRVPLDMKENDARAKGPGRLSIKHVRGA